jgi:hypothetical protein
VRPAGAGGKRGNLRETLVATYHAIAAIGESLVDLLRDASRQTTEFSQIAVELYQAGDLQQPAIKDGVSLYLYRVAVNGTRRNRSPRVGRDGRRYRPSLPLDLHYLLTPWAESAGRQQRLLGWCMRQLEDASILPAGLLNHHGPEHGTFDPAETVELICEPLTLEDMGNIWEAFKTNLQLSAAYVARMVAIDSDQPLPDAPVVQTRVLQAAREVEA